MPARGVSPPSTSVAFTEKRSALATSPVCSIRFATSSRFDHAYHEHGDRDNLRGIAAPLDVSRDWHSHPGGSPSLSSTDKRKQSRFLKRFPQRRADDGRRDEWLVGKSAGLELHHDRFFGQGAPH